MALEKEINESLVKGRVHFPNALFSPWIACRGNRPSLMINMDRSAGQLAKKHLGIHLMIVKMS